ncbi:MAG: single-stranded-DNA-specific exonuclease RecJ [Oscillospiraceae bacterium]|nr:single-stranded-DNA-specific exonuclease RecJ [Oscillospiraceae bacterium]
MKKWSVGKPSREEAEALAVNASLPLICAEVLLSRGANTPARVREYLNLQEPPLSSPFLIKDMREAAGAVLEAIDDGKRICVYGDYDCDGIASTVILCRYIECLGGDVSYYINHRSEGYGMTETAVRKLAEEGTEMIITVDNGISALSEAELAAELGMSLIITDHHQPGERLPEAVAVVNPHRSDCTSLYKDLCGCGVVLKLIAAMEDGDYDAALEQFSDLAAIASIADVVPLTGENREIVRQGLRYIENTENIGLRALIDIAGVKTRISSETAAFMLAPRINASGRFGSASDAVELLLAEEPEEAESLAAKLDGMNRKRKSAELEIIGEIEAEVLKNPSVLYERVLVFYGKGWHHGVIGIIASRLAERFGKPVFIMSDDENGVEVRGSARAVRDFSIYKALEECSDSLTKFGGHMGAGGFSLNKSDIAQFTKKLQGYARSNYEIMPAYSLNADKIMLPEELTQENIEALAILEPFGEGNKRPLFAFKAVKVTEVVALSNGLHTKLKLKYGKMDVYGLLFGVKTADFSYKAGNTLDILAYPELNKYNGSFSINLKIADYRKSGASAERYHAAKEAYERYKRGEGADERLRARIAPERSDLEEVYKALPKNKTVDCDAVFALIDMSKMNYCRFRFALDIFEELGLLKLNRFYDTVTLSENQGRVKLEDSSILTEMRNLNTALA